MKKIETIKDELRAEYRREDFGEMVRGKHATRCKESSNVVVIDPEIQKVFPNAQSVNDALRSLMKIASDSVKATSSGRSDRKRATG